MPVVKFPLNLLMVGVSDGNVHPVDSTFELGVVSVVLMFAKLSVALASSAVRFVVMAVLVVSREDWRALFPTAVLRAATPVVALSTMPFVDW